jgi:nicotinamide-nucleotide amidase
MSISDFELAELARRVGRHLCRRNLWVTTAESCTGGWIAKSITDIAGSSDWFSEGFVTYSNQSKVRRLGVPTKLLQKHGAVSKATAVSMASGALRRAKAQVAVSVTGIAGPGGAVPGKPVGTVWIAWAARKGGVIKVTTQLKRFRGDRESVRRKTVQTALRGILKIPI